VHLQGLGGAGRRTLSPELVYEAVGCERLVRVQQQQGEERARLAARKRKRAAAVVEDVERAEDAEVHEGAVTTVWSGRYRFLG
jgi:hypothetical protein